MIILYYFSFLYEPEGSLKNLHGYSRYRCNESYMTDDGLSSFIWYMNKMCVFLDYSMGIQDDVLPSGVQPHLFIVLGFM